MTTKKLTKNEITAACKKRCANPEHVVDFMIEAGCEAVQEVFEYMNMG